MHPHIVPKVGRPIRDDSDFRGFRIVELENIDIRHINQVNVFTLAEDVDDHSITAPISPKGVIVVSALKFTPTMAQVGFCWRKAEDLNWSINTVSPVGERSKSFWALLMRHP